MSELTEAAELAMLRDFYTKWASFHAISRDKYHRGRQERAAQDMVEAAHVLATFYKANAEGPVRSLQ